MYVFIWGPFQIEFMNIKIYIFCGNGRKAGVVMALLDMRRICNIDDGGEDDGKRMIHFLTFIARLFRKKKKT